MKILTISSFLLSLMTTPTSSQVGCFNSPAGRSHAGDVFTKHIYCCFYQHKIRYLFVLKRTCWKSLILDMYKLEASALNMNLCRFRYSLLSWVLQTTKAIVFLPIQAWNETIPSSFAARGWISSRGSSSSSSYGMFPVSSSQRRHIHSGIYSPPAQKKKK